MCLFARDHLKGCPFTLIDQPFDDQPGESCLLNIGKAPREAIHPLRLGFGNRLAHLFAYQACHRGFIHRHQPGVGFEARPYQAQHAMQQRAALSRIQSLFRDAECACTQAMACKCAERAGRLIAKYGCATSHFRRLGQHQQCRLWNGFVVSDRKEGARVVGVMGVRRTLSNQCRQVSQSNISRQSAGGARLFTCVAAAVGFCMTKHDIRRAPSPAVGNALIQRQRGRSRGLGHTGGTLQRGRYERVGPRRKRPGLLA